MNILKWTVFGLCTVWAMGGGIVMLGYGAGNSPAEVAGNVLMNFGPFVLSLLWLAASKQNPKKR